MNPIDQNHIFMATMILDNVINQEDYWMLWFQCIWFSFDYLTGVTVVFHLKWRKGVGFSFICEVKSFETVAAKSTHAGFVWLYVVGSFTIGERTGCILSRQGADSGQYSKLACELSSNSLHLLKISYPGQD